jgi:hypothetical protein
MPVPLKPRRPNPDNIAENAALALLSAFQAVSSPDWMQAT